MWFKKAKEMWTKESDWTNIHGITKKLKDLDDTHLANLVQFIRIYCYGNNGFIELLDVLKRIQKDRGLSNAFMDRSQIPYKNPNGKWEIWSFTFNRLIELN